MDKVLLVQTSIKGTKAHIVEDDHREMVELVRSAKGNVTLEVSAPLERPQARTYVGKGKMDELRALVMHEKIDLVVMNVDLSPTQNRNIENSLGGIRTVDRTGLILDIFAQRARSKEGRLQVELAQLNYLLPRLSGGREDLSRLGGGIGTRGPGEQKLEIDRRRIRERVRRLKKDLEKVGTHRQLLRQRRQSNRSFTVSLVGYTNAGKSTLLNVLTKADSYVADKLFATLDPVTRILKGRPSEPNILFTDTVGFISRLPHELVEAFQATLEEVREADLILHVIDGSSSEYPEHMNVVVDLLKQMECEDNKTFLVFNKKDQISPVDRAILLSRYPTSFLTSALKGEGLDALKREILQLAVSAD